MGGWKQPGLVIPQALGGSAAAVPGVVASSRLLHWSSAPSRAFSVSPGAHSSGPILMRKLSGLSWTLSSAAARPDAAPQALLQQPLPRERASLEGQLCVGGGELWMSRFAPRDPGQPATKTPKPGRCLEPHTAARSLLGMVASVVEDTNSSLPSLPASLPPGSTTLSAHVGRVAEHGDSPWAGSAPLSAAGRCRGR